MISINRRSGPAAGRRASLIPALIAACLGGCGGDPEAVPAVPVSGTVTIKGKPLEDGTVQFVPEKGRAASGKVKAGQFVLTTYETDDGAVPGKHAVGVTALRSLPARPGAEPETVSLVRQMFTSPGTSGILVEVPAKGKGDVVINLP